VAAIRLEPVKLLISTFLFVVADASYVITKSLAPSGLASAVNPLISTAKVGAPLTPLPLVIVIAEPAVSVLAVAVPLPVRTSRPLVLLEAMPSSSKL
jgi:hypothetical protein